ncbi:hypothetical protein ACIPUD_10845 [Bradyrhizobium sp. CAR08]
MGDVVGFRLAAGRPHDRRALELGTAGNVVVLPVIRIERDLTADAWDGLPSDSAPHHAATWPEQS